LRRAIVNLYLITLGCCVQAATVYEYNEPDLKWHWTVAPLHLTSGMETQLGIELRVKDGIEVNVSGELVGGNFSLESEEHLPLRWESPYWVHEIKARLSTKLAGEYTLPTQTVHIVAGKKTRAFENPPTIIVVHELNSKKDLLKEDLHPEYGAIFQEEKRMGFQFCLLIAMLLLGLWRFYKALKAKVAFKENTATVSLSFADYREKISRVGRLNERELKAIEKKVEQALLNSTEVEDWQRLKFRFQSLRFGKVGLIEQWHNWFEEALQLEQTR